MRRLVGSLLMVALVGCASPPTRSGAVSGAGPRFSVDGPDAEAYGAREGYPVRAINRPRFFVGAFSHYDEIFEGRVVHRAATPSHLTRAAAEPAVRYEYQSATHTLDDYLAHNPATGLLIARGDTILVERYQYGRNDRQRFTSFSMAKTVTSMLIGIAVSEGRIRSIDHPVAAYLFADTVLQAGPGGAEAVKPYNERHRTAGTLFTYASVETEVLGLVLRGATGRPVAEYLQDRIWQPMGAEADATWLVDRAGQEATYCCLNAVLRDYARLGLLLAHDGRLGDRQIIPEAWVRAATTVPAESWHLKPYAATRYFGDGYQTWIFPGPRRMFALLGVHGQLVFVDPASHLVMVQTAVRKQPTESNAEAVALWQALVQALAISPSASAPRTAPPTDSPR